MKPGDPQAVRVMFEQIASSYDILNDLLSLGLHRIWKRQALTWLKPQPGQCLLDLCCGTGDLSFLLAEKIRPNGSVLGLDTAAAPLKAGEKRAFKQQWLRLRWKQGDAIATGLSHASIDGAVMAYGLRNLIDPVGGLWELRRVLKPGSRAVILDFNSQPIGYGAYFQQFYLRTLVVPVAEYFGLKEHYSYVEGSLNRFPVAFHQEEIAYKVGFTLARYFPLAGGQMGILRLQA
uniref:2-methoxy-6-polyprenyl-1,4-benzoquinol methylase, mitochondrial n=1 Tax=Paulinella chromatophora TaxID=39717 RepID=B1X3L0_PAUCH|nr:ubiquinone/menaquinone biosynthesis methyltransferase [Paulinella chromatophora]ACB42529.1 ubiquinone/menaquinone biosynthesis methyltransferase [Paulinella chromatophora]